MTEKELELKRIREQLGEEYGYTDQYLYYDSPQTTSIDNLAEIVRSILDILIEKEQDTK